MCKTRSKTIYEQFFISEAFAAILIEDFGYQPNEKIDLRNILTNIMKWSILHLFCNYINKQILNAKQTDTGKR